MKRIDDSSIEWFESDNKAAEDIVRRLTKAGKCHDFDVMADTVYAPTGMTGEDWDRWLEEHHDFIVNHFQI